MYTFGIMSIIIDIRKILWLDSSCWKAQVQGVFFTSPAPKICQRVSKFWYLELFLTNEFPTTKCVGLLTQGGGFSKPPKLADIIGKQPLPPFSKNAYQEHF